MFNMFKIKGGHENKDDIEYIEKEYPGFSEGDMRVEGVKVFADILRRIKVLESKKKTTKKNGAKGPRK